MEEHAEVEFFDQNCQLGEQIPLQYSFKSKWWNSIIGSNIVAKGQLLAL